MSQITLIRHGQAQSMARDEISYDSLSDLGHRQSRWLGEHISDSGYRYERVFAGTLTRHTETALGMKTQDHAALTSDARLNEIAYFTLATLLEQQHGVAIPQTREGFMDHMPLTFSRWQAGDIADAPETFETFETRAADILADIEKGTGPALVVTSGGVIAMILRQVLGLDINAMARICLSIMNTSVHHLNPLGNRLMLTQFNGVPHLETPKRQFAQTHL